MVPIEAYLVVPVVVFVAYTVFAISGFGSALVAIPLLSLLLPVQFVVPMAVINDFMASLTVATRERAHVNWNELLGILPFVVVGIALGVRLLGDLSPKSVQLALGIFVAAAAVYNLARVGSPHAISRWWAVPTGLVAGALGALFGIAGPLWVLYFSGRIKDDKSRLRATMSATFVATTALRISMYLATGLLLQDRLLGLAAAGFPAMLAGLYVGNRLHARISVPAMGRIVTAMLFVSGGMLVWRSW
jgi:uncharacterized membrane protein YfcA